MSLFDKFQARVGRDQGAARLFVAETGYFNLGDKFGSTNGTDIAGAVLNLLFLSPVTRTSYTLASAIQTTSIVPAKYGYVVFNYPSLMTSCRLPSAEAGATLFLNLVSVLSRMSIYAGNASLVLAATLSDISCIAISTNSAAQSNHAWIQLMCFETGTWAITNQGSRAIVTPQAGT